MPDFEIDASLKNEIDLKIEQVLASDVIMKSELQDAGHSIFVQLSITPSSTAKQIFQMYDDIDAILSHFLPNREGEPRWAQSYALDNRILYGNIGGIEFP